MKLCQEGSYEKGEPDALFSDNRERDKEREREKELKLCQESSGREAECVALFSDNQQGVEQFF